MLELLTRTAPTAASGTRPPPTAAAAPASASATCRDVERGYAGEMYEIMIY